MLEPREFTEEEVRAQFLEHVWGMIDYWAAVPKETERERLSGLAHSLLTTLDGCSGGICGFRVIPNPHPDDKAFHQQEGDNWYPDPPDVNACDIGGGLHELLYKYDPQRSRR